MNNPTLSESVGAEMIASSEMILRAATVITAEHMRLQRAAEVKSWNAAIDKASEIIADWIAHGRDETMLFDKLQDAKVWTS